jgi:hypothetical protein
MPIEGSTRSRFLHGNAHSLHFAAERVSTHTRNEIDQTLFKMGLTVIACP